MSKVNMVTVLKVAGLLFSAAGMLASSYVSGKEQEQTLSKLVDEKLKDVKGS